MQNQQSFEENIRTDVIRLFREFYGLVELTTRINNEMSHGHGPDASKVTIPREFLEGWINCLMFLLRFSPANIESGKSIHYLAESKTFLDEGRLKILKTLRMRSLYKTEAVLPLGIAGVLINQLIQDVTDKHPPGFLRSTYEQYVKKLVRGASPLAVNTLLISCREMWLARIPTAYTRCRFERSGKSWMPFSMFWAYS